MTDRTIRHTALKAAEAAAALERAADGVSEELVVLQAEVAARDAEVERLQEICDDRLRVIDELGEHAATYRRAAEDRAGLVAALDFDLQRVRADLERAERERNDALAAAEAATLALDDERQRARLLAGERDAELRTAHRDAQTLRSRVEVLENALAARAGLVEELQAACDQRLRVIAGLTEEVETLRRVAEERRLLLETNEARYREREAAAAAAEIAAAEAAGRDPGEAAGDGVDWRALAEERERALHEVSAEAERRAVLLAELTAALEGRTREVEGLRKRLSRAF
ncbi:MAG: hypothetical protein JWM87_3925 [Candidatus Eremiobacteraeota bacterium]|nr:hypothetical protein [Candidatus Eremiobacteraeota bacterium]